MTAPHGNTGAATQRLPSSDYVYLGKGKHYRRPADFVLAYEKPDGLQDGINVAFVDGRVFFVKMDHAMKLIEAILLPAAWLKEGRSEEPLLLPPAVRALDHLGAMFQSEAAITPGFLVSLREALGLTQEEFGRKLGVSKMTVSRWERGRMQPGGSATHAVRKLQRQAQRAGVRIDGRKR